MELSSIKLKLLRLVLDPGAQSGEVETGRQKLFQSLANRGLSTHDLMELVEAANNNQSGNGELPPKMSCPDYGLCRMPFGKTKGQLFMDLSPHELHSARRWAMSSPDLAQKFAEFIHDVDAFFKQSGP